MSSKYRLSQQSLAAAALACLPMFASAQLEEVLVTAERREASLQDVPASVSALSGMTMENKKIENLTDIQYQVPNLNIGTNTGTSNTARLFLRGIGEDESRATDPAVGMYVDGVYIGRAVGALVEVVDLAQIEVLRGPQGTLYGRNSNAGAVKLVSKKPDVAESFLQLGTTLGSDDRQDLRVIANWALSDDTALRLSYLSRERDAFHRLNPNGDFADRARDVGDVSVDAFRLALGHAINDDWKLDVVVDRTEDDSTPVPDSAAPGNDADNDLFTVEPLPGTVCSAATPITLQPIGCFTDYHASVETQGIGVTLTGDLGDYTFTSITGYRELQDELASRISFPYFQKTDQDQFSQELTLSSNYSGPFNFIGGLYYFQEDVQLDYTFILDVSYLMETESTSAFVQGNYALTDALTLTAGVRYTDEERDITAVNKSLENGDGTFSAFEELGLSNLMYRASLDYQLNDSVMLYTSYATGFKSGGASTDCFSAAACFRPVDDESVATIEVGMRSEFLDDRLRLNLTYFTNDYEDLQIGATIPNLGFTRVNVAETEIQGVELETIFRVTDQLTLSLNAGWLDGEYTDMSEAEAAGLTGDGLSCPGGVPTIECAKDLEIKNAPELSGTVSVHYAIPLDHGDVDLNLDFAFEDDSYSIAANAPPHVLTKVGTLINARAAYTVAGGRWQVALWGKNLGDEEYARAAAAGSFTQYAAPPRTWGIDASYRF